MEAKTKKLKSNSIVSKENLDPNIRTVTDFEKIESNGFLDNWTPWLKLKPTETANGSPKWQPFRVIDGKLRELKIKDKNGVVLETQALVAKSGWITIYYGAYDAPEVIEEA